MSSDNNSRSSSIVGMIENQECDRFSNILLDMILN